MNAFNPSAMLSFDLETTTVDTSKARIVTSAMVRIHDKQVDKHELLADPGVEIPEGAQKIHGITTEYARENGRPHEDVLSETIQRIKQSWQDGLSLVVFNASYDLSVLRSLSPSFLVEGTVFDPFVIDKHYDPYRKGKRTLQALCDFYGVKLDSAHDATEDALAAARIAWKQMRTYPELQNMDAGELMENQTVWYYDMQTSFRRYLEGQGKDVSDVNTTWPMIG